MKRRLIFFLVIAVAALCLVYCSGGGGGSSDSTNPSISAQRTLDFGVALIDGGTSSRQLIISNRGTATLELGDLSLSSSSVFHITSDCSGESLAPGETCSLTLSFPPTSQANYSATLRIPSNDSDNSPFRVTLAGKGRALNLNINEVLTEGCSDVPTVLKLLVSVTDGSGNPVAGLADTSFTVEEDGIPKAIHTFTHPITTPISIDLVFDYSGSISAADLLAIQDAAKAFVEQLEDGVDEAGVIKFALTIGDQLDFTTDQAAVEDAIDAPYPGTTQGTILYDALITAINETALRSNDRRAIIVFSDGYDEESTSTLSDVSDQAILKGVPIFTIAYTDATHPKPEIMQQLAQETGGEFYLAPSSALMEGIYDKIAQTLSQQYLLGYVTTSTAGETLNIKVTVDDSGDLGEAIKQAEGCS